MLIETERLLFRRFSENDMLDLLEYLSNLEAEAILWTFCFKITLSAG